MSTAGKLVPFALLIFLLVAVDLSRAAPPLAGKLILVQGEVSVRRADATQWEAARLNQELYTGDAVRTGLASRAAIVCTDESQIKLNEKTLLILKSVAPSPRLLPTPIVPAAPMMAPSSIYEVPEGEIWLRNKREKFQFELQTPAAQATIRGTEFNIQVGPQGRHPDHPVGRQPVHLQRVRRDLPAARRAGLCDSGAGPHQAASVAAGRCRPVVPLLPGHFQFSGLAVDAAAGGKCGRLPARPPWPP